MRVGLVARCLNTAHIRGMGRYVYEMLRCSADEAALDWTLFGDDPRYSMRSPPNLRGQSDVFTFRGDRFHFWEQIGLPRRAKRARVDVLHCTEGSLPLWQPVPTVVTLHDTLAWQERDGSATSRLYFDRLLPVALSRCAEIITISESSRRDILQKWPGLEKKLTVIPHGIGDEYLQEGAFSFPSTLKAAVGEAPYLVYLGGAMPRKRFDWALQVLQASGVAGLHLVACGIGSSSRAAAQALVPPAIVERVHFAPFLSDDELLAVYQGASAVLYPTLYEGFGFPAIEAQAAGAPAIFSAVSSLAELVGPLAMMVEPWDLSGWVDAVRRALALGDRRAKLKVESRAWARAFSWQRSFDSHLAVYRRAASLGMRGSA